MTSILGRIFGNRHNGAAAQDTYSRAMDAADSLIEILKTPPNDAVKDTISNLLRYRDNGPYVLTIFEAQQEMSAPLQQKQAR